MNQHFSQLVVANDLFETARRLRGRYGIDGAEWKLADLMLQNCGLFDRPKGPWIIEAARCVLTHCDDELRGEGHARAADEVPGRPLDTPQPNDDALDQEDCADQATKPLPDASSVDSTGIAHNPSSEKATQVMPTTAAPLADERGRTAHADKASFSSPRSSAASRGPSAAALAAARSVMGEVAQTIYDTLIVDKRPIGDWTLGECQASGVEKLRHGFLLQAIGRHYRNADPRERVRDKISIPELERMSREAKEVADAA